MAEKERKLELLAKISSCETRILGQEKNISTLLYNKRHEHRSLYCTLEELDLKFSSERKFWKQALQQEIAKIRNSVDAFHKMLLGTKPDPQFVEKLKQTMESIEASITAFKEKQREIYESLLQEEQSGTQEMSAFDRKLESWLVIPKAGHIKPEGAAATVGGGPEKSKMPSAVMAFERFLQQTGGRHGGWDAYDHQIFLRVLSTHPPASFLEVVGAELPTKTPEEIKQHQQWHAEYSTLLDSKRKAIEQWREQKEKKKAEVKPATPKAKRSSRQELLEREREARFAKLEAWKAEQRLKHVEAEEQRLKKELEETRRKELENKRRVALKSRVEEYARQREEGLSEQRAREEASRLRELAERRAGSKELERFRARDMGTLAERRKKAEVKEAERLERERRLESLRTQVEVKVERDPSRLYKLTKGWEERKKATMEQGGGGGGETGPSSLPRRAVPLWRQRI